MFIDFFHNNDLTKFKRSQNFYKNICSKTHYSSLENFFLDDSFLYDKYANNCHKIYTSEKRYFDKLDELQKLKANDYSSFLKKCGLITVYLGAITAVSFALPVLTSKVLV